MKRANRKWIALVLLSAFLLGGCAGSAKMGTIQKNVAQSEEICQHVVDIINWQLEGTEEYRAQRAIYNASGDERDMPEDNLEEIQAKYDELMTYIAEIDALKARIDSLPSVKDPNEALVLQAAKDYFGMLERALADLASIFDYFFATQDALEPMATFEPPEITTGLYDYSLYAGQLSQVVGQSQAKLAKVACPEYMKDSHADFAMRVDEYQSFCQDFSVAVQFNDPLRIASCNYRIQRLNLMLEKSNDAVTDDFNLQFHQVANRLNGSISTLRMELLANIKLL